MTMAPRRSTQHAAHGRGRSARTPAEIGRRGWWEVTRRVRQEVADDHTALSAAGVAYFGFLAAIPALAAVVSVYGLFTDPPEVQRRTESLFGALPEEARALLREQLASIVGQRSSALGLSVLISVTLSMWSASSGMGHLIEAVNVAYDEHDHRSWFVRKAWALVFTVGAVAFVITAVAAVAGLAALTERVGAMGVAGWLLRLLWVPVVMAGFAVGLAVLYRYGPDRAQPRWRWVSWGSALAVIIWIAASAGFQVYVSNFGSYNKTYGSLAAVVILLFWLYLTAFVVLLGAQLNAELEHQTARDTTTGPDQPLGRRNAVVADEVAASAP